MGSNNLLRKQVRSELRKRRYVVYTTLVLSLLYICLNVFFGDASFPRLMELKRTESGLRKEVGAVRDENAKLRASLKSYKESDFLMEKHSREEFGLSKQDEFTFVYEGR